MRESLLDLDQRRPASLLAIFHPGAKDTVTQEFAMMIKKVAVATTAALIMASPFACAEETSSGTVGMRHPVTGADLNALTDARIGMTKAALQLTPEQEKYWPAVEAAIRARAKNRQARLERVAELRDSNPADVLREKNPVELMQQRAERLTQRAADLKKLADAWEPLYKTLSEDQKKRMAFATFVTARAMRETIERRVEADDDDE